MFRRGRTKRRERADEGRGGRRKVEEEEIVEEKKEEAGERGQGEEAYRRSN